MKNKIISRKRIGPLAILTCAGACMLPFSLAAQQAAVSEAYAKELEKNQFIVEFKKVPERTPQYPLKTKRMIFGDEDIELARKNIAAYPEAARLKDRVTQAADKWLEWSDESLRDLMADGRVPRGFDLNAKGCPEHGDKIFSRGPYPWIIDPENPFKVKCPVGSEEYPSNDYAAYVKSGYKEKKGWDTKYVDEGWGWIAPDGERYWFVAHANHWLWMSHIVPAISALGKAYVLTGDKRYAHKAAVMLYRVAEVYPSMDHNVQSRYGFNVRTTGGSYHGKIVNLIWETGIIQSLAIAYDNIWDSIDGDRELLASCGRDGKGVRSFIEANLLEDGLDGYLQQKIQGNYGMHQTALLYVLLARQHMDTRKYHAMIVEEEGASRVQAGVRYALYNMIFRDGLPLESPSYNMLTVDCLTLMGDLLRRGGTDLFEEPRLKAVMDGPLNQVVIGKFTPDIGDSGSVLGGIIGKADQVYKTAYKIYRDPRYLAWLRSMGKTGANSFSSFESLFMPVTEAGDNASGSARLEVQPSRLFAGYGLGVLNNTRDATAVAFNYGFKGTHYHWDFLNFDLFANGQKMTPDLGYPDAMNEYVKELYIWSTNTVSHNTVVVDAQRQTRNAPGILHDFAAGDFARAMDASSPAYPQTSEYRRGLVMVDVDDTQSYVVDFFRIRGGKQHDYVLHGPPGTVTTPGSKWSGTRPGTLAGPDVQVGEIYDDSKLGAPGYSGGYGSYKGSGFQYLFNVQQREHQEPGKSVLEYAHVSDDKARLRIHLLPSQEQEVYMADGYNKPRARNYTMKYLVARTRAASQADSLQSTFVSVLEPFGPAAYITSARLLEVTGSEKGRAVEVKREGAAEVVLNDTDPRKKSVKEYGIETDALNAVVTFGNKGQLLRVFFSGGTYLRCKGRTFRAEGMEGVVTSVDVGMQTVGLQFRKKGPAKAGELAGKVMHFSNPYRVTVHPVAAGSGTGKNMTVKLGDDLLIGRLRINQADQRITTRTELPFAPIYKGSTLLDNQKKPVGVIEEVAGRRERWIRLSDAGGEKLKAGDEAWISNLGVGDEFRIKSSFSWVSGTADRYNER